MLTEYSRILLKAVEDAGHWGVLRTGYIGKNVWDEMTKKAGMQVSETGHTFFQKSYFADGTTTLDPKAAYILSLFFGIDPDAIETLNNKLSTQNQEASAS